jgi:hypothetical protein
MGLTVWKNAPHGPVRKADTTVAKNYLTETEIRELNRVVTMYLDYAEDHACAADLCIWPIGSSGWMPSCGSTNATS